MRFGLNIVNSWPPDAILSFADAAEAQGWEGFFLWDHISFNDATPLHDPWVLLGAVASRSKHLTIGPLVTPLARRRPQVVARQSITLDHLSGGRSILGVGLGGTPWEFEAFGEEVEAGTRARKLDEALEVLTRLWEGGRVDHRGRHYQVRSQTFLPRPVHGDRIPVWVGGVSEGALRRAARWDGWAPYDLGPEEVGAAVGRIQSWRRKEAPFDVAYTGVTPSSGGPKLLRGLEEAGVTWWLEAIETPPRTAPEALKVIRRGPPAEP